MADEKEKKIEESPQSQAPTNDESELTDKDFEDLAGAGGAGVCTLRATGCDNAANGK